MVTLALLGAGVGSAGCGQKKVSPKPGFATGSAYLDQGLEALQRNEYHRAIRLLATAARNHPDNATAFCNLGIAYWKIGEKDKAIESLRIAADLENTSSLPLEFLAQVLMGAKRWQEAAEALERANQICPETPRILTAMAVAAFKRGDPKEAVALLQKAAAIAPGYAPALYNLGVVYRDYFHNLAEAQKWFDKFVAAAPNSPRAEVLKTTGKVSLQAAGSRMAGAVAPAISTGGSAPGSPPAAGATEKRSGVQTAQTGGSAAVKPIDPLVRQARAAVARDALDEALVILSEAVRKNPQNRDALWELAVLYERQLGRPDKAAQTYQKFRERFPDDPRVQQIPPAGIKTGT